MKNMAELIHLPNARGIIGRKRIYLNVVSSTNTWLLERPHLLIMEGLMVYAGWQTAGRGSKGRTWLSLSGRQLFCSIALKPSMPQNQLPGLTLFIGAAVAQGLTHLGIRGIGLKWPNDVLLNGKKIAGILCEMGRSPQHEDYYVVAGIGLNLQGQVSGCIAETATSLEAEGYSIQLEQALDAILDALNETYWNIQAQNKSMLLQLWRNHSHTLGKQVRIVSGDTEVTGVALDILENGALLLQTENGSVSINHGSLFYTL